MDEVCSLCYNSIENAEFRKEAFDEYRTYYKPAASLI